jgi:CubicO group peptidase (beta-lactamase class C family)
MNAQLRISLLLVLFLLLHCCKDETEYAYDYRIPEAGNDGWEVGSAGDQGLQTSSLVDMMEYLASSTGHQIHSILIIKGDKLVFEEYFEGYLYATNPPGSNGDYILYDRETDHYLASVSKSITSVIFGAAVKEGYIASVDTLLRDVLPEYQHILTGEKAEITLEHLLTMSSGLHWDEWSKSFEDPENDVIALFHEEDPIEYILSKHMINAPGQEFLYNSGGTNVLGAVIERLSGMGLLDFGNQYVFGPLNVQGGLWERMAGGYMFASGGIYLRAREQAKIGSLFLNDGYWGNQHIITEEWIRASVTEHIETNALIPQAHAYGYQWWMMDYAANGQIYDCFFAAGWGDQYIFVFPDPDMIIVVNSGNFLSYGGVSVFSLVEEYILQSLRE